MRKTMFGMTREQRLDYLNIREVKDFYDRLRGKMNQTRGVIGAELTIPKTILDLLSENLEHFSKLKKYVRLRTVKGEGRQIVSTDILEAIWTDAVQFYGELKVSFSGIEVEGYRVSGFISLNNCLLDGPTIDFANELEYLLGEAIGYALDKAILYGTGERMPLGFITRLADKEDSQELLISNIKKINTSSLSNGDFFKAILKGLANAKINKSRNGFVLAMNETTWKELILPEFFSVSSGILTTETGILIPALGAHVEFMNFIPYGDIAGGYMDQYLLVDFGRGKLGVSDQVRFMEDEIAFKGFKVYDGNPIYPDSFVLLNINNEEPTTQIEFAKGD
ncbi:phage major capsid protein [Paenibacillus cucumis (ex Kampfer et al. 2016)]|uniref:Phage major capsid protein n=1 Tax=Paenibacillus cucumis (ex Kampfer et al. 2016) TaxID=1776858 RepID=A0ABS7KD15_9BACL|nr:phage major capsid protein [Paenibacillus cucumis (ex Kampfer et al. 2016)]MBY0202009.1 phage major capsid protein [Paenibacillus cucumis (ex Kampfer et al. 2016)]